MCIRDSPLTRGSAPGPRWGLRPQTPVIDLRSRARHERPLFDPHFSLPSAASGQMGHFWMVTWVMGRCMLTHDSQLFDEPSTSQMKRTKGVHSKYCGCCEV